MRSIRLSLLVYFLLLLSVALGVIGWLSYEATRRTLRDKEETARALLRELYENRIRAVGDEYDHGILERAQTLARLAEAQAPDRAVGKRTWEEFLADRI